MSDNTNDHLERLMAAARAAKPDVSRVEFGFETRLMSRIRAEQQQAISWASAVWHLAPVFAAIVLMLAAWVVLLPNGEAELWHEGLTAGVDQSSLITFLTGE